MSQSPATDLETSVRDRYADGAREVQPALCCPTDGYDAALLAILPDEIIEKDYGCGDPSKWALPGDRVLDLGSGAGKICYILSQKVGTEGQVTGVDFNDAMLDLARKYQSALVEKIGHDNIRFTKGRIQDLALDLNAVQAWLETNPVTNVEQAISYEAECDRLRADEPMIVDGSLDLVVSNCVLNLVRPQHKTQLFNEIFRVLADGGRAVISDIVADADPTPEMMDDPELWSGCISGALREDRFCAAFTDAGFGSVEVVARQDDPWQTVGGIDFRSVTIRATKGDAPKSTCC